LCNRFTILENERFRQALRKTNYLENLVASSIARKKRMCLNLTPYHPNESHKDSFDYVLFDPIGGRASLKIEQQESWQIRDEETDSFCIELATYTSTQVKRGKLHYCQADLLNINCPHLSKMYLFDFNKFKQYCVYLHEQDLLNIYDSKDAEDTWRQSKDTNPVRLAYLEIQKTLYDLSDDVDILTYEELDILQPLNQKHLSI